MKKIILIILSSLAIIASICSLVCSIDDFSNEGLYLLIALVFITTVLYLLFVIFIKQKKILYIIPLILNVYLSSVFSMFIVLITSVGGASLIDGIESSLLGTTNGLSVLLIAFGVVSLVFAFLDHKWAKISAITLLSMLGLGMLFSFIATIQVYPSMGFIYLSSLFIISAYIVQFSLELCPEKCEKKENEKNLEDNDYKTKKLEESNKDI